MNADAPRPGPRGAPRQVPVIADLGGATPGGTAGVVRGWGRDASADTSLRDAAPCGIADGGASGVAWSVAAWAAAEAMDTAWAGAGAGGAVGLGLSRPFRHGVDHVAAEEREEFVHGGSADILSAQDYRQFRRMGDFVRHVPEILSLIADTLYPRTSSRTASTEADETSVIRGLFDGTLPD